jgi:hypothetical protein
MMYNRQLINATLCANPQFASRYRLIGAALGAPSEEGVKCNLYM